MRSLLGGVGAVRERLGVDGVVAVHAALVAADEADARLGDGEVENVGFEVGDLRATSANDALSQEASDPLTVYASTVLRLYQFSGIRS